MVRQTIGKNRIKKNGEPRSRIATGTVTKKAPAQKKTSRVGQEELLRRIQETAYAIFERRGYRDGYEKFDWDIAEKIITLELAADQKKLKKAAEDAGYWCKVEQKAYDLYLQRGQSHGDHDVDWYLAQRLVKVEV